MKILWVGDATCSTGFKRCTHAACDALHKAGHEVIVLGINHFGDVGGLEHGYPYRILPAYQPLDNALSLPWEAQLHGLGRFPSVVEREQPDLVVLLNDAWNVPAYFKVLQDANVEAPRTVGWIAVDARNQNGGALEKLDHVVAWTKFGERELVAGGYEGPISIVGLGVDLKKFSPGSKSEARKAAGFSDLSEDAYIVGMVGRNQQRKRIDLAIEYFAAWIHKHHVENAYLYLHISPTGEQACNIESLIRFYGLGGRIILSEPDIGIGIKEPCMQDLYRCFDLYWLTSQGEGWGLPILEAMACGVPCCVPASSGMKDWTGNAAAGVECSTTAITAPFSSAPYTIGAVPDPVGCVHTLDVLYREKTMRERYALRGLELAQKLTWEATGKAMVKILESVHSGADLGSVVRRPVALKGRA